MKHVFYIRSNTFIFIVSFEKTCQKKGVRASSRVPNTHGLVLSSVFRCLEPVMKHLPSFLTYYIKHKFDFSDVGNKQDHLPVLSQTSPLQGLTINYAPFTPKLETSSKLFSYKQFKIVFLIKAAY